MHPVIKLFVPCALSLYLASACVPDLDSLSAEYVGPIGSSGSGNSSAGNGNGGGGEVVDSCENGAKDGLETDVDCGGTKCDVCRRGTTARSTRIAIPVTARTWFVPPRPVRTRSRTKTRLRSTAVAAAPLAIPVRCALSPRTARASTAKAACAPITVSVRRKKPTRQTWTVVVVRARSATRLSVAKKRRTA